MDGFSDLTHPEMVFESTSPGLGRYQQSLKSAISCVGTGLHSGQRLNLTLRPAPVGHGIVFRRTDLIDAEIPARFDHVIETRLCTILGLEDRPELRIGTVEHLMAALYGLGVDNALVEIDGPEVPILDGSAAAFVFLLQCAGVVEQDAPRPVIEILHPVRVAAGEAFAELQPTEPAAMPGLQISLSIDFAAAAIGRQALSVRLNPATFAGDLAQARTFTLASDVAALQAAGLARGGSLGNAIVVDEDRVLNPGGLRMADEFVRHKILDVVGDLALANAVLSGRFVAHRSGHRLNNELLRALFADRTAWRLAAPFRGDWLPAAA